MAKSPAPRKNEYRANPTPDAAPDAAGDESRLRQGNAPACPYCSKAAKAAKDGEPAEDAITVICESKRSDPYFTRYYCPTTGCGFAVKVPRPQLRDRLRRAEAAGEDFSAR